MSSKDPVAADPAAGEASRGVAGAPEHFIFRYCPSCGAKGIHSEGRRRWHCGTCGFEYFHNVAAAAGVFVEGREGILLIERARDPARGLLCLPGGFVEPGERAEEAARRECREELGWEPGRLDFFASFPNAYEYAGVPYATCDIYFLARVESLDAIAFRPDPHECSSLVFLRPEVVAEERLAFDSLRRVFRTYMETRRPPS